MTNRNRWLGVYSLLILLVIAYIDRVNMAVLIVDPDFLKSFGLEGDRAGQGALMSLFLIGYGVAAMVLTPLYETYLGYRRGLFISLVIWALLTAISPLCGSLFALLVVRAVLGASEGPLFSLKTMYISDHFTEAERGKPNAVSSMGVSVGLAVGFPMISYLMHSFGWHASFHILALINLAVGLPLVHFFIKAPARADGGSALGVRRADGSPASLASVFRGALSMSHLGMILLIEIFTLAYLWGSTSWLPSYLVQEKSFSLQQMGWLSSLPFIVAIGANFLGGVLVDVFNPKRTALIFTIGGLACAASVLGLIGSASAFSTMSYLMLASICWGIQGAAIPTLVQRFSPAQSVGSAYGLINGVGNIAAAFMPMAMGSMMKTNVSSGFSLLIISQVGVAICGIVVTYRLSAARFQTPATHQAAQP